MAPYDYRAYLEGLRRQAPLVEYAQVQERGKAYPLVRIDLPGSPYLLVTAGFHGEEPAGPLTLLDGLEGLLSTARARGIGLRIYPCINPSGFEVGSRYNASGEKPNNDFLRYEVEPGVWKGELRGEEPLRWTLYDGGPKETRAVRADLAEHVERERPAAALDLHQDNWMHGAFTYAYVFGDDAHYRPLMERASAHAQVAAQSAVDEHWKTDDHGLVRYHDGSITDWFHRLGVPLTAAVETTTRTPMEAAKAVNRIWLEGFLELIAARGTRTTSRG